MPDWGSAVGRHADAAVGTAPAERAEDPVGVDRRQVQVVPRPRVADADVQVGPLSDARACSAGSRSASASVRLLQRVSPSRPATGRAGAGAGVLRRAVPEFSLNKRFVRPTWGRLVRFVLPGRLDQVYGIVWRRRCRPGAEGRAGPGRRACPARHRRWTASNTWCRSDARLERDVDVRFESVTVDDLLVSTSGASLRLVFLDACRNNPLALSMQRTAATRTVSGGSFADRNEDLLGDETLVAAVRWDRRAAEQGNARARGQRSTSASCTSPATPCLRTTQKRSTGFRRSADQGHPSGRANLGWMYENGRGVQVILSDTVAFKLP